MLFECLEGCPVTIDSKPILKDIRINIVSNKHQLRAKMVYIDKDLKDMPLDIVVYNYSNPRISIHNQGIEFDINGEEYIRHIGIQLRVGFNIFKKILTLDGTINGQQVRIDVNKDQLHTAIDMIKTFLNK